MIDYCFVVVDEDEPYSPEDDEPYSPGALDDVPSVKPTTDLEREMEEIELKIAEEKQKIQKYVSVSVYLHLLSGNCMQFSTSLITH